MNRNLVVKTNTALNPAHHGLRPLSVFPCCGIMGNDSGQMQSMERERAGFSTDPHHLGLFIDLVWLRRLGEEKKPHKELFHLTLRNHSPLMVTIATDGSIQAAARHCKLMKGAARFHKTCLSKHSDLSPSPIKPSHGFCL